MVGEIKDRAVLGVAGDSKSREPIDLHRPCFCGADFGNAGVGDGVVTIEGSVSISDFTRINEASVRRLPLVCMEDRFVVGSCILIVGGNRSSSIITSLLPLNKFSSCGLRILPLLACVGEDLLCLSLLLDQVWYLTKCGSLLCC